MCLGECICQGILECRVSRKFDVGSLFIDVLEMFLEMGGIEREKHG